MEAVRGVVVLLLLYLNTYFSSAKCGGGGKSCGIAVRVRHVLSSYTFKMLFHYVAEFFVLSSGTEMDGGFFCLIFYWS